ncbi:MAG: glutathione S-transferase family protein [Proteobacteria bacterium]|nr:glutathione S-transferase family protein [Pseudomonadota bacterium]
MPPYRLFGSELSPYSVKVRSYLRYKDIPHEWVVRSQNNMAEFQQHAKLPLIPLLLTPDGASLQDSTPILEHLEAEFPEPSIHPDDPTLEFVSALLEEYGDEWGNKPMFHYRWTYEEDQRSCASRIAAENLPDAEANVLDQVAQGIVQRMVPRLSFVGSSEATRDGIEASFKRQIGALERHLAHRPYLFGERPAFADFGVFAQIYEASTDPTPGHFIEAHTPSVLTWCRRMLDPTCDGPFESWDTLGDTLAPLLHEEVGRTFLPWSAANAKALAAGEESFSVELHGKPFSQQAQKYHAKSLQALKARYAAVADKGSLDPILDAAECRSVLAA